MFYVFGGFKVHKFLSEEACLLNVVTFYGNSKELFIIRGYIRASIEDLWLTR